MRPEAVSDTQGSRGAGAAVQLVTGRCRPGGRSAASCGRRPVWSDWRTDGFSASTCARPASVRTAIRSGGMVSCVAPYRELQRSGTGHAEGDPAADVLAPVVWRSVSAFLGREPGSGLTLTLLSTAVQHRVHDVGDVEQRVYFGAGQSDVGVLVDSARRRLHHVGELPPHDGWSRSGMLVIACRPYIRRCSRELSRTRTNLSPMAEITWCVASQAVVIAR